MHWIIQDGYYRRDGFERLVEALEGGGVPYDVVRRLPAGEFEPAVTPTGRVLACGSLTLAAYAARRGWKPGSFHNADHDVRAWLRHYGTDLLNHGSIVARLDEVVRRWPRFFIRPCGDTKAFAGGVFTWDEFASWRTTALAASGRARLDGATVVAYAPLRKIFDESRFFVVDGRIVAQSRYRIGGEPRSDEPVDDAAAAFAHRAISHWQPARAFVIDVARVARDEGPGDEHGIVEINALNGSAFYACDVRRIVAAVESMEFPVE